MLHVQLDTNNIHIFRRNLEICSQKYLPLHKASYSTACADSQVGQPVSSVWGECREAIQQ
jgi:hypothetical protein